MQELPCKAQTKLPLKLKVGDLVLIHKDAYYTSTLAAKLGSLFIGPFRVVDVVSDNAYVIDIPIHLTRVNRTFNINRLKPFKTSDKYVQNPPKSLGEAGLRVKEVLSVVGVSFQHEHVLTKFRDVDPAVTIPVSFEAFLTLGRGRCESLLRNLKNVISHDANPTATNAIDALIKNLH